MDARALTFREFLNDIRLVVTSPSRRFTLIHGRGSVWGSLLLLAMPFYFGFGFAGGIYFDRDPFPGYSFILPAILAIIAALLKVYAVHLCGRLLQSKGRYSKAVGSYRDILALFGYTNLPSLLAMTLAFTLFSLIPWQMGAFVRDFRIYAISLMIAVGIALFLWNLILVVLALRLVYPMRDYKIVFAFIIGSVIFLGPAALMSVIVIPAQVSADYVRPLLNDRVLRFMDADNESSAGPSRKIVLNLEVDRLRYRLRDPERYDFATCDSKVESSGQGGSIRAGSRSALFSLRDQVMGRIVGMPGETVELSRGTLLINGRILEEPYILPEYRSDASFPATPLSATQYLILPENRKLLGSPRNLLVVNAGQVNGRAILNKWPFGWWLHRPSAYQKPAQQKVAY